MILTNDELEFRLVPIKLKLQPTFHPIMNVKVKRRRTLENELEILKIETKSVIETNVGIALGYDINVAFLTNINGMVQDCIINQSTDKISFIGVDLPQDILLTMSRRIENLEKAVGELSVNNVKLSANNVKLEKAVDELSKTARNVQLRGFIESGREHFWRNYGGEYYGHMDQQDRAKLVRVSEHYDNRLRKFVSTNHPNYWTHFIEYVIEHPHDRADLSYLDVLNGGNGSLYKGLSEEVHITMTEEEAANLLRDYHSDEKLKKVFLDIFGKSVDEVLIGRV